MRRSIEEIYHLIIEKKKNAENHYIRESKTSRTPNDGRMLDMLEGEIKAYTDILILLETSGVVENEVVR